jgi:drug/metabolite transporter (DMT)-like permease
VHGSKPPRKAIDAPSGLALLALLGGNVALAIGPLFVRMATEDGVGPVAAGFWRLALAAPLLLLLTRATGQPIKRPSPAMLGMIALGGLFFAADLAAWHVGILQTKLANATLFGNSTSLIFPIYGFLVARAWPSRGQAGALVLAAIGAVLLMGRSYELDPRYLVGDLFCLLAGLLYTFYLISIDRARATLQPWPVLALSTLAGVLPLLGFAALAGERIWPEDWGALAALALVSQVIGQGLMVYAMGHVRPLLVGLALLSQPVVAAAIGWTMYGEALGLLDWVGAALIAAAIVLVRRNGEDRKAFTGVTEDLT